MLLLLLACIGLQSVPSGDPPGDKGSDPFDSAEPIDSAGSGNSEPVADAGGDQSGRVGVVVSFDGEGSYDPDGDSLNYTWTLDAQPSDSHVSLIDAHQELAQLVPDADGTYRISLVVDDGAMDSEPDTVTLSVASANSGPVADAGADQTSTVGDVVMLDGSGSSDPDGDPLQYSWTLSTRPAGSAATLSSSTAARPSFTTDVAGVYQASLTVSDGTATSGADSVRVVASSDGGSSGGGSDCGCQSSGTAWPAVLGVLALALPWGRRLGRQKP